MIRSALRFGDDVIHFKVSNLKVRMATCAVARLLSVECFLVSAIVRHVAKVGALGIVGSVNRQSKQAKLIPQAQVDKFLRLGRYVYT